MPYRMACLGNSELLLRQIDDFSAREVAQVVTIWLAVTVLVTAFDSS